MEVPGNRVRLPSLSLAVELTSYRATGSWLDEAHQVLWLEGSSGQRGGLPGGARGPGPRLRAEVAGTGFSEDPGKTERPLAGDVSWDKAQAKHVLERLQDLFTNISQLTGKGRLGLYGQEA